MNYVRKFLKAITLADIATTNGVYISRNAFEARSGNRLREGLGWLRVPAELPQSFIKLWKEAITLYFQNPYNHTNEKRKIQNSQQLGDWHELEVKNKTWEWFLCVNKDITYKRDGDTWRVHLKTGRRQYSYLGNYVVCPNQDTIASVYEQGGRVYVETTSMFETADLQLRDMDTSRQYNDLYDNGRWRDIDKAMRLIQFHPDILLDSHDMAKDGGLAIVQGIKDGTARIVSDGSYKKDTPIGPAGTSAFYIAPYANNKEEQCITGYNWVTGTKEDQSSYRSEAAGVRGALAVLECW
jgi:hypothetical protein